MKLVFLQNVPIRDIQDKSNHATTFIQLKPRLANVLISALQVETDSLNIQMLLGNRVAFYNVHRFLINLASLKVPLNIYDAGGLIMLVSDTAAFEEVDKPPVPLGTESPTNLLCSG